MGGMQIKDSGFCLSAQGDLVGGVSGAVRFGKRREKGLGVRTRGSESVRREWTLCVGFFPFLESGNESCHYLGLSE
jgi:hypothetical protein